MTASPEIRDVPIGTPTRLVIPAIALDSPIVSVGQTPLMIEGDVYGQWNTADNSVGWHNLSAKLGQLRNKVLNGHSLLRDLPEQVRRACATGAGGTPR